MEGFGMNRSQGQGYARDALAFSKNTRLQCGPYVEGKEHAGRRQAGECCSSDDRGDRVLSRSNGAERG